MINERKHKNLLFFTIGLFSTFDALKVNLFIFKISISALLLFIYCILNIFKDKKIYPKNKAMVVIYYFSIILSTFLCINTVTTNNLFISSLAYSVQVLIIYLLFLLTNSENKIKKVSTDFFKGLKISVLIQAIWGFSEFIFWNLFNFKLNDFVFVKVLRLDVLLGIGHNFTNFTWNGGVQIFRITGIGWEPASFAIYMIMGIVLFDNYIIKVMFAMLVFISNSRTGFVVLIVLFIIYFFTNLLRKYSYRRLFSFKYVSIFLTLMMVLTIFLKFNIFHISDTIELTFNRVKVQNLNTDTSYSIHYGYYGQSIDILLNHSSFKSILFGYGSRIAGYPFSLYENATAGNAIEPWNPESDFVSILIGNGVIGWCIFYLFALYCIKKSSKRIRYLIMTLIFSGFLYIYNMGFWYNMILILSIYYDDDLIKLNHSICKSKECDKYEKSYYNLSKL